MELLSSAVFLVLACIVAWPLFCILRIIFADADLTLLQKKPVPKDAFQGKVVWITGASKGIGELVAQECARLGAKLILSSRSEESLLQVKAGCPGEVEVLPLDLAGGSAVLGEAVRRAEGMFQGQGVDILIHNAAYRRDKLTAEETPDDFLRATFEVNVFGTIEITRHLLPHMLRRRRGLFVVVSSAAGKVPSPTQAVYAASKHALQGYFTSMASEVAGSGVGVCLVCPGPIAAADQSGASQEDKEAYSKDRMSCERCVELIVAATAHRVPECWVSKQPVLGVMYLHQYLPQLSHLLFAKVGPKRVAALKAGSKELYGTNLLFQPKNTTGAKED